MTELEDAQNSQRRHQNDSGNLRNNYQLSRTTQHDGRRRNDSNYARFEIRKVISIPSINVGRVIGKGGSKIRELMSESQAHVNVENSPGPITNITLSGSSQAIIKAQELIDKIIEKHNAWLDKNGKSLMNRHKVDKMLVTAVHTVTQKVMLVDEDAKENILLNFIWNMAENENVIIFCSKRATAIHITTELCLKGIKCQSLYGDTNQTDHEDALEKIVDGTVNVLVAIDVASRGIEIQDLTHVVNFDFPSHIKEYVHRVDRTSCGGKTRIVLSFFTKNDWKHADKLIQILVETNQDIPSELEQMAKRLQLFERDKKRLEMGKSHERGKNKYKFGAV